VRCSARAEPERQFSRAPGEGQQKREITHRAARLIEACAARLKAHTHRALRDDQGGVLVKGAAHGEYKNKTRTFWQVKNSAERENFLTDCFKMIFSGLAGPPPSGRCINRLSHQRPCFIPATSTASISGAAVAN